MNRFLQYYSPMNAFHQGYALGDAFNETQAQEAARQRAIDERQALSDFGQGDQLAGYEGVPGAVRPAWLKQLYQTNPTAALQVEQQVAAPFELDRQATKAVELEQAKLAASVNAWKPLMPDDPSGQAGPPQATGQPVNAFAAPLGPPSSVGLVSEGGLTAPNGAALTNPSGAGSYTDTLMGKGLGSAHRTKKTLKFSLKHGPIVEYEQIPEFEAEKARVDAAQKGRQVELEGQRTADILNNSRMAEVQRAHQRVYDLGQAMSALRASSEAGTRNPTAVLAELDDLMAQRKDAIAYRDSLLKGKDVPAPASADLTPEEKAQAAAVRAGQGRTRPGAVSPPSPSNPNPVAAPPVGAGLPYKQAVEVQQEKLKGGIAVQQQAQKEKMSIANKSIEDAHSAALKAEGLQDSVNRMLGLVDKGMGSTVMGAMPWGIGESIMAMGHDNKRLQSLNAQLVDLYKNEGQTKAFDTLPELKIVASRIPSLDKGEDQNREDMVSVVNLMDARRASGDFLEQWAHGHGGTLDGARGVLRGWMQHNPLYQTAVKNGETSISKNQHYIPLDIWTRLRQRFSEKDLLKKRDSGGIQIIGDKIFLKD